MTLKEKKEKLELQIHKLVNKFNAENEVKVSDIEIVSSKSVMHGDIYCRHVKVGIEL